MRGKKRDGQQRKEKGKDGNGKNERIYPLENILFDTNIATTKLWSPFHHLVVAVLQNHLSRNLQTNRHRCNFQKFFPGM